MRTLSAGSIFSVLGTVMLLSQAQETLTTQSKDVSILCLIYDDLSLYDLRPIQSTAKDYSVSKANEKYYFNLCGQTIDSCSAD